jgi:hypothetical protein
MGASSCCGRLYERLNGAAQTKGPKSGKKQDDDMYQFLQIDYSDDDDEQTTIFQSDENPRNANPEIAKEVS